MLNIVAFIICALAAILQWNNNWWFFGINSTFAVLNLLIAIQWVIEQIKKQKGKTVIQYEETFSGNIVFDLFAQSGCM